MFICEKESECVDCTKNPDESCEHWIEVAPARYGRWIQNLIPTGVSAFGVDEMTCEEEECSECHRSYWVGADKNFCPNCGADMRERNVEK